MKKIAIALGLAAVGFLAGCGAQEPQQTTPAFSFDFEPIDSEDWAWEESEPSDPFERPIVPFLDYVQNISQVDLVQVEVRDGFGQLQRHTLQFSDHGTQRGGNHLMVPLSENPISAFTSLGFRVEISIDSDRATLWRLGDRFDFNTESITIFRNHQPVLFSSDFPFRDHGTLYIPFEMLLMAAEIDFTIDQNRLIIHLGD